MVDTVITLGRQSVTTVSRGTQSAPIGGDFRGTGVPTKTAH